MFFARWKETTERDDREERVFFIFFFLASSSSSQLFARPTRSARTRRQTDRQITDRFAMVVAATSTLFGATSNLPSSSTSQNSRRLVHKHHDHAFLGGSPLGSSTAPFGKNNNNNNNNRKVSSSVVVVRASASSSSDDDNNNNNSKESGEGASKVTSEVPAKLRKKKTNKKKEIKDISADDINPIAIGRKSREMFDGFFNQITSLTRLQKSTGNIPGNAGYDTSIYDMDLLSGDTTDMIDANPQAKFTTVLVTGATGRVGKVIVRKLLLRGYGVRALIRRESDKEFLPPNVEVFVGDVSDLNTMREAVKGCAKIMYCARASSTLTSDLYNVEVLGVQNACAAMQDYFHTLAARRAGQSVKSKKMLTDFKWAQNYEGERQWSTEFSQSANESATSGWRTASSSESSTSAAKSEATRRTVQKVKFEPSAENWKFASWSGFVTPRTGVATLISPDVKILHAESSNKAIDLSSCEGLTIRYKCDAKKYSLCVIDTDGNLFRASMRTKLGWKTQSIPWSRFVSEDVDDTMKSSADVPQLDVSKIAKIGIQFRAKVNAKTSQTLEDDLAGATNQFSLVLEYLKANPRGEEADIVLLSCFGAGMEPGEEKQRVVKHKKDGECALRRSGLQYAIVRPAVLSEEPSGGKALVFDQGERLTQTISCADVADVCVKSLHDSEARNRTFDVAYDKGSEGDYELVTQVASKNSGNYLTPALQPLERNT